MRGVLVALALVVVAVHAVHMHFITDPIQFNTIYGVAEYEDGVWRAVGRAGSFDTKRLEDLWLHESIVLIGTKQPGTRPILDDLTYDNYTTFAKYDNNAKKWHSCLGGKPYLPDDPENSCGLWEPKLGGGWRMGDVKAFAKSLPGPIQTFLYIGGTFHRAGGKRAPFIVKYDVLHDEFYPLDHDFSRAVDTGDMVVSHDYLYVADQSDAGNVLWQYKLDGLTDWTQLPRFVWLDTKPTQNGYGHLLPVHRAGEGYKLLVVGNFRATQDNKNILNAALWDEETQKWLSLLDNTIPDYDLVTHVQEAAVNPFDSRIILIPGYDACHPMGIFIQRLDGHGWQAIQQDFFTIERDDPGCLTMDEMHVVGDAVLCGWTQVDSQGARSFGFRMIRDTVTKIDYPPRDNPTLIREYSDVPYTQLALFGVHPSDDKPNHTVGIVFGVIGGIAAAAAGVAAFLWWRKRHGGGFSIMGESSHFSDPDFRPARSVNYTTPVAGPEEQY